MKRLTKKDFEKRNDLIKKMRSVKIEGRPQSVRKIGKLVNLTGQQVWNILFQKPKYDFSGIKLQGRDFLKEKRRIMDSYTCHICGVQQKEEERIQKKLRRLDVHHTEDCKEGLKGKKYKNCTDLNKMYTCHHKCHLNLKKVRIKMSNGHK